MAVDYTFGIIIGIVVGSICGCFLLTTGLYIYLFYGDIAYEYFLSKRSLTSKQQVEINMEFLHDYIPPIQDTKGISEF